MSMPSYPEAFDDARALAAARRVLPDDWVRLEVSREIYSDILGAYLSEPVMRPLDGRDMQRTERGYLFPWHHLIVELAP